MASYTEDAMRAKLSSLNETQESIVTVAQWMLFHKRHAESTAQLWLQRLQTANPGKRLNFVYLANEVVQQSKARKRPEFLTAFSPVVAEAISTAYKGAPSEVQQKLRRVVEVWRDRQVFDASIQEKIELSLSDLDRSRAGRKGALGGSLFSSGSGSAPAELQPLVALQIDVTKAEVTSTPAITNANAEFERVSGPTANFQNHNVHAAQLGQLLKKLSTAEGAVAQSIKVRQALIGGLEKLLKANQESLERDEKQRSEISERRKQVEQQKGEVELAIMRGLSSDGGAADSLDAPEPPRPDVEGLTPPPVESLTPPVEPPAQAFITTTGADVIEEQQPTHEEPAPQDPHVLAATDSIAAVKVAHTAVEALGNGVNGSGIYPEHRGPSPKKRKVSAVAAEDELAAFLGDGEDAMDGIDPDVAEMLGGGD